MFSRPAEVCPRPSAICNLQSAICNLVAVCALGLLPFLPGPAGADPPPRADPLPLRRILISPSRIPAELARAKQGILKLMPRQEFEALVQRAALSGERAATPPRLVRAVYTARLEGDALVGGREWTVVNPGPGPAVLPMPDLNLALRKLNFDDASPAVLGELDGKNLGLLLPRPGKQSVFFDWSLRGAPSGGDLRFDLQVPPSPVAFLELTLPAGVTVATSKSTALLSGPSDAGEKGYSVWKLEFGGRSRVDLVVRRPAVPGRMPPLLLAQLQTTQQLTPQHQLARYDFQIESLHAGVRELVFEHDPALEPYDVTVARAELQAWGFDPPGKGPARSLTVRLREPFQGGSPPLRVSVLCLAPLLKHKDPRSWASPGMRLRGAFTQAETLKLQVHPDVRLEDWRAGRFRLTRTAPAPDGGRLLTLADGGAGRPEGRPSATVRTHGTDFLARQLSWWQVGPGGSSLTLEVACTVRRGALLRLPVRVTGVWQVKEVRLEPAGLRGPWLSAQAKGNTLILADLARAAVTGETVKLTARLHSPLGAKLPPGGLALPFPDVEPVGATLREGTLAIGVAPAYQASVPQASHPPAVPEGEGPWAAAAPNFAYAFRGAPVTGRLRVAPQKAQLNARASGEVQLGPGRALLTVRLQLEPVVGSPEAVDLWLSGPTAGPWKWSVEGEPDLVRGLQRRPGLEAAPGVLALGAAHPFAAAAALRAVPAGEHWRLLLGRPLTRRETVTLQTALVPRTGPGEAPAQAGRWDVPLLTVPGAAAREGELTVAPGGADLLEVRGTAVRETAPGGVGGPQGGRVLRYGPALFPGQFPALSVVTRAPDPDRPARTAPGLREACDRSALTTYVGREGRLVHHFRFRVWNWRGPEAGKRSLPVWLPAGSTLRAARVQGEWLRSVGQQQTPQGLRVELPVPAGPHPHHFELLYAAPDGGAGWWPWARLTADAPRLPVEPACVRRTWRLPPGVVPLGWGARRLPDPLAPGDRAPWWEPARRAWQAGGGWLGAVGPEFAPDAWAAQQRQSLAEAEQAVRRLHPRGKPCALGEVLEQVAAAGRTRGPLVLDAAALWRAGLGPGTTFQAGEAAGDRMSLFAPLGLAHQPCRAAPLLTTRAERGSWEAASEGSPPGAVEQAVAEAAAHGRDSSGRFQTVAHWLAAQARASAEDTALPPGALAGLGADGFGPGWTEWEPLPGGPADELVVVRQAAAHALGLTVAGLCCLLAWRAGRALSGRWAFRLLTLWLAGAFLALFWLPPALREAAWWPAVAGVAVAVLAYARAARAPRPRGSRPAQSSTDKAPKTEAAASAVALLLAALLPAQPPPAGPPAYPVLILPGPEGELERQSVLVAPDLLKRLESLSRRGSPPAGATLLSAEYTGLVVGDRADFTAELQVYCPADEATVAVPLGGVSLKEGSLWAGARVFPVARPAPLTGYAVRIGKRGPHPVNTLRLSFSVPVPPGADARELRFSVPRLPRSRLTLALPPGAQAAQAVSGLGTQSASPSPQVTRLVAELGREGNVLVRWRTGARPPRRPTLEVREAYLWDLRPPAATLTAVLQYTVAEGTAERFELGLPEGLAVRSVDVAQAGARPAGAATARLKGARFEGKGGARKLTVDLQSPVGGEVQLVLGLLAPPPGQPGLVRLPLPNPQPGASSREGLLGYVVDGPEPPARAPALAVASVPPEAFARAWQQLGLRERARPTQAFSFRRRANAGPAALELTLRPVRPQARQEVSWQVNPRHADFRLTATVAPAREELALVEWDMPGVPGVTVAEVSGPAVDSWSAAGGRLQVWLRPAGKEKAEAVRLEARGWVRYAGPQEGTFRLPCLRLRSARLTSNLVRVDAAPGLSLAPGPAKLFANLQPLPEGLLDGGFRYRAVQPVYAGTFLFRPSPVTARASTLGLVQARDGALRFTGLVDLQVPHGELRSVTVRLRGWEGEAVRLEAPRALRVRDLKGPRGERAWAVTLPPGVTRRYAVKVTGEVPLKAGALVMPELSAPGAAAGASWVAVVGPGVRAEAPAGLAPVKDAAAELGAWPAEAARVRKEGAAWKAVREGWSLRLVGQPAGAATVRLVHAEQEAAVADLRGWVHQATYRLHAGAAAELRLTLPPGARLLAAAVDGAPVTAQPEGGALALSVGEGAPVLRLRWAFEAGAERLTEPRLEPPRFRDLPGPPVVWRVDVPAGHRLSGPPAPTGPRPADAATAALARAEGQLQISALLAERLRASPSEAAAAQLAASQQRVAAQLREAANLLAGSRAQGAGPGGKSLADWLRDLRQRSARLGRAPEAEKGQGGSGQAATVSESGRTFFLLPERGLPSYWYAAAPGPAPRVELTSLAEDRWRESASATELLLIGLAAVWVLWYLPRVRRWLGRLLPEQVMLLGWLGTEAFGLSPLGLLLMLGGACARLGLACAWLQDRLRRARPEEQPPTSSFHSA
jgi:hypothetical protein